MSLTPVSTQNDNPFPLRDRFVQRYEDIYVNSDNVIIIGYSSPSEQPREATDAEKIAALKQKDEELDLKIAALKQKIAALKQKNEELDLKIANRAQLAEFSDKLLGYIRSGNQPKISSKLMKLEPGYRDELYKHLWEVCGSPKLPDQMGRSPIEKWGYCAFLDGSVEGYSATVEQKEKALLMFMSRLYKLRYKQ